MDNDIPAALRELPGARSASVCTCAGTTTYVALGRGLPVLLLFPADGESLGIVQLAAELASSFRVIAPGSVQRAAVSRYDGAPAACSLATWLPLLLDGLGVERAGLIAAPSLGMPLLAFAALEPERVSGIVLWRTAVLNCPMDVLHVSDRIMIAGPQSAASISMFLQSAHGREI